MIESEKKTGQWELRSGQSQPVSSPSMWKVEVGRSEAQGGATGWLTSKGTCCQACEPEIDPLDPHVGGRDNLFQVVLWSLSGPREKNPSTPKHGKPTDLVQLMV